MSKNMLSLASFAEWCRTKKGVFSAYGSDSAAHEYFRSLGLEFRLTHEIDAFGPFEKDWPFATQIEWLMTRASYESCGALVAYQRLAMWAEAHS